MSNNTHGDNGPTQPWGDVRRFLLSEPEPMLEIRDGSVVNIDNPHAGTLTISEASFGEPVDISAWIREDIEELEAANQSLKAAVRRKHEAFESARAEALKWRKRAEELEARLIALGGDERRRE